MGVDAPLHHHHIWVQVIFFCESGINSPKLFAETSDIGDELFLVIVQADLFEERTVPAALAGYIVPFTGCLADGGGKGAAQLIIHPVQLLDDFVAVFVNFWFVVFDPECFWDHPFNGIFPAAVFQNRISSGVDFFHFLNRAGIHPHDGIHHRIPLLVDS